MKYKVFLVSLLAMAVLPLFAAERFVTFAEQGGAVSLKGATIGFGDNEPNAVQIAAANLQQDFSRVMGFTPSKTESPTILIGTVGSYCPNPVTPVNDFLMYIKNLQPVFIPVNKVGKGVANREENLRLFNETFASDRAICYFPFGLCSRKVKGGKIMDLDWKKTFVSKSKEYHRDIIPTHIDGQNTRFFYNLARLRKRLKIKANIEMAFLVDEFFKQRNKTLTIIFGKPIPYQTFDSRLSDADWAEKLRCFSYNLAIDKDLTFDPEQQYLIP